MDALASLWATDAGTQAARVVQRLSSTSATTGVTVGTVVQREASETVCPGPVRSPSHPTISRHTHRQVRP